MGRRILAFFLGMLFGIVVLLGGLVAAVYIGATTVKPGDIYPDSDKFLGDLAQMSLYDIYVEISNLYKEKLGITNDDGLYFTLGEFLEKYHIDPVAAFGKPLPDDLLEVPILELFGGTPDTSLTQIKASVLFSAVNFLTQTVDEEGNLVGGYFSESAIAKLYAHSMAELNDSEKGPKYVFAELLLVDLLSTAFPAEEPTEGDKLMWAIGQSSIGRMLGGMGGNLMLQFKADGAFATMGTLALNELIGNTGTYMKAIFGNKAFADLIDDEGNLLIDGVIEGLYLGGLLGYERQEIDVSTGYAELATNDGVTVLQSNDGATYAIVVDGVGYLAKATCNNTEHTHVADCIDFVWYNMASCQTDGHEHTDECYTENKTISGMSDKLSNERIKDLNSLSETVKRLTLYDVLGDDVPVYLKSLQNTKIGELSSAIDQMYLGEFLGYEREASDENGNEFIWLQKHDTPVCGEEHEHTDSCYVTTVEGMMGKLSNKIVKELGDLSATIKTFTLKDVLGDSVPGSLKSIENTPVGEIGEAMNNMYLGEFLAYYKRPVDDNGYSSVNGLNDVKQNSNGDVIRFGDDETWYEAVLNCVETHDHDKNCYDYVWYKLSCTDESNEHEHVFGENGCYTAVDGLVGRISRLKMIELSGDRIREEVNETKLSEVINIENANGLFKELGEVKIGNLSKELDALYVGVAMGYSRLQVDKGENWTLVVSDDRSGGNEIWSDGKSYYFYDQLRNKYYVAQLNCNQEHKSEDGETLPHSFTCYGYTWLDCKEGFDADGNAIDHEHTIGCIHAKGLNAKIANMRIDELSGGNLTRIATSLTIGDLIESEMMSLGDTDDKKEENAYKLAIISCNNSEQHYFTSTIVVTGTYGCSLQDYFTYKATLATQKKTVTAEEFWLLTHGLIEESDIGNNHSDVVLSDTDLAHRDSWQNQSLTTFVSELLGAL